MTIPTHHDSKRCISCGCEIHQIRKRCWECSMLVNAGRSAARSEARRRACGVKPRAFKTRRRTTGECP